MENGYPLFWLNALKDTSGNWKWLRSGNDFTYTNWVYSLDWPNWSGDYVYATNGYGAARYKAGTWMNSPNDDIWTYIICELDVEV